MNDQAVERATGRSPGQWIALIRDAGKGDASHKAIADFLHEAHGVSYWWAQELTVEYERRTGRRVPGQTQDGLFQIGVSRTLDAPPGEVWEALCSASAIRLLGEDPEAGASPAGSQASRPLPGLASLDALDGQSPSGVYLRTTTFEAGSHVRIQWRQPAWKTHTILQVRLTPKTDSRTILSFHQEKLPTEQARQKMREHWSRVAGEIAASVK
jgi:uncharacterized protein YndB with AHSA1/START domain